MNFIKKIKNNKGVTLIELLVAVTLFSVVTISATKIFAMVVEGQRNAIAAQELQSNMRYIFEFISKEIRMAQGAYNGIDCGIVPYYKTFNTNIAGTDSSDLYFRNRNGECVAYELWVDKRIYVKRGASPYVPITPEEIEVEALTFHIDEDMVGTYHSKQGSVRMMMEVKVVGKKIHEQYTKLQTTIASRYYE